MSKHDILDIIVNQHAQLLGGYLVTIDGAFEYQGRIERLDADAENREVRFSIPHALYINRDSSREGRSPFSFTACIKDHESVRIGQKAISFLSENGKKAVVCRKEAVKNLDEALLRNIGRRYYEAA